MYGRCITARELQVHWHSVASLSSGQEFLSIYPWHMPSWDDLCRDMRWQMYTVDEGYFGKKEFGFRGVYRLIGLAEEGNVKSPATFNRVCGQDTSGTLYIGSAGFLHERLNKLQRSIFGREHSHGAASSLRRLPALDFPPSKLAISLWFPPGDERVVEMDLIKAYMNSFGDTPPLNYSLRR